MIIKALWVYQQPGKNNGNAITDRLDLTHSTLQKLTVNLRVLALNLDYLNLKIIGLNLRLFKFRLI